MDEPAEVDPEKTILHSFCSCPDSYPTVEGDKVVCSICKMPYHVVEYEWNETDYSVSMTSTRRDAKPSDIGR